MSRFVLGAVAYAPKVITIWEGFKEYFSRHNLDMDYILYSNYETQVEALFAKQIDAAWNSPLAHLRAQRIGNAQGTPVSFGPMRDTDQNLCSVLVVRSSSTFHKEADLQQKTVGFGAIDSPQARLIPLDHLRQCGLIPQENGKGDYYARRFDVLGGKHGDHIGGEREAARALMLGEIDASWMLDSNYQSFASEGLLPAGETRILCKTGSFDHCIFTFAPSNLSSISLSARFTEILLNMKWSDPEVRPLLELEGLKEWRKGRTEGFALLNRAIDSEQFYDANGKILDKNYRY